METYSHLFTTLYDEPASTGRPFGIHHSVLRAIVCLAPAPSPLYFHDFAILWDGDHDRRVVWVAEKMLELDLLAPALVIGEGKGAVTVLTATPPSANYATRIEAVSSSVPFDSFSSSVEVLNARPSYRTSERAYLTGVASLWSLGSKPATFTTRPCDVPFVYQRGALSPATNVNLFAVLAGAKAHQ